MSTQITVRIADELVQFVDEQVSLGNGRSRASVVERALRRELRRYMAEQDLRTYATTNFADDDTAAIAAYRSAHPLDLSDLD